jgi:pimeloyl-ACP methyl ester carboxylesterase
VTRRAGARSGRVRDRAVGRPPGLIPVGRLADPAALTASLSLYRAILTPESLVQPPMLLPPVTAPAMGVWSSGDFALVEEGMTGSARHVTGPWRYERIDGAGHWLQLDAPGQVNALLLDFLGQQDERAALAADRPSVSGRWPRSPARPG